MSGNGSLEVDKVRARIALTQICRLEEDLGGMKAYLTAIPMEAIKEEPGIQAEILQLQAEVARLEGKNTHQIGLLKRAEETYKSAKDSSGQRQVVLDTVDTLKVLGQYQEAYRTLEKFLEQKDLDLTEENRYRLTTYLYVLLYYSGEHKEASKQLNELISGATNAGFFQVALSAQIAWGAALLETEEIKKSIDILDQGRIEAVRLTDPGNYLVVSTLLAQAYEADDQKPEAYGTLLRARVSLEDLLGEKGVFLPQFLLDHFREKWSPEHFENIKNEFESTYKVS